MFLQYIFIIIFCIINSFFFNECINRIPKGQPVLRTLLQCPECGRKLNFLFLLPVLGWIFSKCNCGYFWPKIFRPKIYIKRMAVEVMTIIFFTLIYNKYGLSAEFAAMIYLISILIIVFFIDMEHRIIPNKLVVAGLFGGILLIIYNAFYPMSIYESTKWWCPLLGILPGCGFLFFSLIGTLFLGSNYIVGMGDIKIFAPIGIFLGWRMCTIALILSIVAGGIFSLILIITGVKKKKDTIAFGPFIALATFITIIR